MQSGVSLAAAVAINGPGHGNAGPRQRAEDRAKGERNQRFLSPLGTPFFPQTCRRGKPRSNPRHGSEPTNRITTIVFPLRRPSPIDEHARTVLAGKGSLRRAQNRRALASSAPFWRPAIATGGSDGNTIELEIQFNESELQTKERKSAAHAASSFSYTPGRNRFHAHLSIGKCCSGRAPARRRSPVNTCSVVSVLCTRFEQKRCCKRFIPGCKKVVEKAVRASISIVRKRTNLL